MRINLIRAGLLVAALCASPQAVAAINSMNLGARYDAT